LEKKFDAAVQELAAYAARRPKSAGLQRFIGTVLSSYGHRTEARAAFTQALQVQPQDVDARLALAQIDIAEGKLENATQSLRRLAEQGSNVTVSLWLGNLSSMKGDPKAAMEYYRTVLELDPNQVLALNNLAWLMAEDGKQVDQALGFAQKAAELAPDHAAVQNTLGRIFYQKGLYTMAVRHLERAVASGSNAARDFYLGAAYLKSGNRVKGETRLQAVMRQYPNSKEASQARQLIAR
jgi:tetratricopeptide (TPR) repeat protein